MGFRFSGLGRSLSADQIYCHATAPQTAKPNVRLIPNKAENGMIDPLLPSRPTANQSAERHERTDGNVLVVHKVLFRQRQRVHDGLGFVNGLRVDEKNHASAVAP